jgi:hypothetical protein
VCRKRSITTSRKAFDLHPRRHIPKFFHQVGKRIKKAITLTNREILVHLLSAVVLFRRGDHEYS